MAASVHEMRPGTVVEQFLTATERDPQRPFARVHRDGAWRELPLFELRAQVERIAGGLIALGVAAGDRVALLADTRPEWTACDYAIQCTGATVVPVYPSISLDDCRHILADAGARLAIVEDAAKLAVLLEAARDLADLRHVIVMDGPLAPGDDRVATLAELERRGSEQAAADPGAFAARAAAVDPDGPCTIVYTSGTTGPPKGCVILQRNYRAMTDMALDARILREGAEVYLYLPLAHVFARLTQLLAVTVGGVISYTRGVDRIADDLLEVRPHVLPSVPRVFEKVHAAALARGAAGSALQRRIFDLALRTGHEVGALRERGQAPGPALALRHALADRLVLGKVRARLGGRIEHCVSGGAPIAPEVLRFFHACGILVLEGYGLSESSTAIALNRVGAYRFGTVGQTLAGGEVRIADDGEVLFRGPNVFAGYHGQPDATAAAVVDGWLQTGDIGELDADGYLTITDRKKDIIVTAGGKNVAPANIENALKTSPLVAEACVIGDRRPYVVALVTIDRDALAGVPGAAALTDDPEALARYAPLEAAVAAKVAEVNASHARVEQVKRFRILPGEFTQEGGELTPTLKVKRRFVARRYAAEIDALYA